MMQCEDAFLCFNSSRRGYIDKVRFGGCMSAFGHWHYNSAGSGMTVMILNLMFHAVQYVTRHVTC